MMFSTLRRSTAAVAAALVLAAALAAPATAAAAKSAPQQIPVTGAVTGGGTFSGILTLDRFVNQNGSLVAVGTLSGLLTDAAGTVTSVLTSVAVPTQVGQATCDVLHLNLGPLSLNLLGLNVDLNTVVLDITSQPGPGNLLGNLLCAVAGLLDNPGGLAKVLNDILGAL